MHVKSVLVTMTAAAINQTTLSAATGIMDMLAMQLDIRYAVTIFPYC